MRTIISTDATTIYFDHPEASWACFCFNTQGDFFINSDWGFFGFAWRAFGDSFRDFLASTNADYVVGKLQINYHTQCGKEMEKRREENLTKLVQTFITLLKENPPPPAAIV